MKTRNQELIEIFKVHRDTSFEKMKKYPEEALFYKGRADGFEFVIHVLELEEEIEEGLKEVKQIRDGEIPKPTLKDFKLNSVSEEEVEKGRSKAYDYKFK